MEVTEETPAPPSAPRTRVWIARAAFEAALIVLGLVGALVIDNWRDTREREARVQTALGSIRGELEANRDAMAAVIAFNEGVMRTLRESAKTGNVYLGPIVRGQPLSAVAWEAARDGAITNDIDHATLMTLGRVYDDLALHRAAVQVFLNYMYTYDDARSLRENPLRLAGWMNDITGNAGRVYRRIDEAVGALGGQSQQLPSDSQSKSGSAQDEPATSADSPRQK